jgi:hypothetical protein
VRIDWNSVPLLPGVLAARGLVTNASGRTWASYGTDVGLPEGFADEDRALRNDPQTSGARLAACAPPTVDAVLAIFRKEGFARVAVVGEVAAGLPRLVLGWAAAKRTHPRFGQPIVAGAVSSRGAQRRRGMPQKWRTRGRDQSEPPPLDDGHPAWRTRTSRGAGPAARVRTQRGGDAGRTRAIRCALVPAAACLPLAAR